MKHTVYRIFTVGQYEKEEEWLNEMSAKGMQLCDVGLCRYVFEEGEPGKYIYRLELLRRHPTDAQSIAYIRFMEDLGVEHVGSLLYWVYFRKKAVDGPFDLYSDISSKIRHFRRIKLLCDWAAGFNLVIGIVNIAFASPSNRMIGAINIGVALLVFLVSVPIRKKPTQSKKESALRE
jgi:hypothetical protein